MEKAINFDISSSDFDLTNVPINQNHQDRDNMSQSFVISPGGDSFLSSTSLSLNGVSFDTSSRSSPEGNELSSNPVVKHINQMLFEETMDDTFHLLHDPSALKAAEKALYDVLGEQYPSAINSESPDNSLPVSSSVDNLDPSMFRCSVPKDCQFQPNLQPISQNSVSFNGVPKFSEGSVGSCFNDMVHDMFNNEESMLQFKRGLEEARMFLPNVSQLVVNLQSSSPKKDAAVLAALGGDEMNGDSSDLEGRANKQSVVSVEESELIEKFDKVLLWPPDQKVNQLCRVHEREQDRVSSSSWAGKQSSGLNGGKTRSIKHRKKDTVDLRTLLIQCAQAVAANDFGASNELLKLIRQNSSASGDGFQRTAHFFADGLEARMSGTGSTGSQNIFTSLSSRKTTAIDMLSVYKIYRQAFPFKTLAILFSNEMILRAAQNASTLHVVDFGVLFGFNWPVLIQQLSVRPGGPPKLRITGIEFPQHGFRPTERIEEAGRCLAKYCERFNVPFEYNPIASHNWESITLKDLKLNTNEVTVAHCQYRFKNLYDETINMNCPRDAVLNLIRKMNPTIFVHTVTNCIGNSPFFITRFKEAIFHYSSLFDMHDCILPRDDEDRFVFEKDWYGRELINVIACEGLERVERPETYKQWQIRTVRAGFKQVPLKQEVMEKLKQKMKTLYHQDFVIDEDSNWMLQGWKGRIIYASSCWVPA